MTICLKIMTILSVPANTFTFYFLFFLDSISSGHQCYVKWPQGKWVHVAGTFGWLSPMPFSSPYTWIVLTFKTTFLRLRCAKVLEATWGLSARRTLLRPGREGKVAATFLLLGRWEGSLQRRLWACILVPTYHQQQLPVPWSVILKSAPKLAPLSLYDNFWRLWSTAGQLFPLESPGWFVVSYTKLWLIAVCVSPSQ